MALTHGSALGLTTFLSQINLNNGVVTAAARGDKDPRSVIGQIRCVEGHRNAHLTFIFPDESCDAGALALLLDGLAQYAGLGGSFGLLAEVDELAPIFESLRKAGFSVYGWQRIYKLPFSGKNVANGKPFWQTASAGDEIPIRHLFQELLPPLAQAAEPLPAGRLYGLVYREQDNILAYVETIRGPQGIYLKPFIHPNVENIQELLAGLEGRLLPLLGRQVFMAVRSHQAWLETPLAGMEAEAAERQALMVKHLAAMQRKPLSSAARAVLEDGQVKPGTPPTIFHDGDAVE